MKISFEQIGVDFFGEHIYWIMQLIVSSTEIAVNNDSTLNDTSSLLYSIKKVEVKYLGIFAYH